MQRIRKTHRTKRIHRRTKVLQTETYQLNLIERSDPFLPDSLNENTQKIENAMIAHEENIEQRLTVLEAHHFACGTYQGTFSGETPQNTDQFIPLPFSPKAVYIGLPTVVTGPEIVLAVKGYEDANCITLDENGFTVHGPMNRFRNNFIAFA